MNPIPEDLERQRAERHFLGKDLEEAEALFGEASITYREDLRSMEASAFRFHVHAAIRYIQSESATGDRDILGWIASILEPRVEYEVEELASICASIVEHYDLFELTPEMHTEPRPRL